MNDEAYNRAVDEFNAVLGSTTWYLTGCGEVRDGWYVFAWTLRKTVHIRLAGGGTFMWSCTVRKCGGLPGKLERPGVEIPAFDTLAAAIAYAELSGGA